MILLRTVSKDCIPARLPHADGCLQLLRGIAAYFGVAFSDQVRPTIRGAAAMQQIADWLEKLGLGQYAQRFAENGISTAALPHLTDQDLKDIGVLLGRRRVILAALAELTVSERMPLVLQQRRRDRRTPPSVAKSP